MSTTLNRRAFLQGTALAATAISTVASAEDQPSPAKSKVIVITHAGGAHIDLYFRALANTDEVASVVLADPDGAFESAARAALGDKLTAVSKDRDALLAAEKPGMALVSVEAARAPEAIAAALAAGCHVLAEKPACVRAEDFEQIAARAKTANREVMLALANRVNPEVVEARRRIAAGEFGKIYGLEMHLVQDQTRLTSPGYHQSWMADKARAGGGHLTWLGIHWLDLAMFITGAGIEQVAGFAGNVGGQPINIEDSVAMAMRFDNATFGTLTSGYYLDKGNHTHIKIWCAQGWLQIDSAEPNTLRWYAAKTSPSETGELFTAPAGFDPYHAFVRAAVRASLGLEAPPITTEESLRVLKTVYGLYRAAETGSTVLVG